MDRLYLIQFGLVLPLEKKGNGQWSVAIVLPPLVCIISGWGNTINCAIDANLGGLWPTMARIGLLTKQTLGNGHKSPFVSVFECVCVCSGNANNQGQCNRKLDQQHRYEQALFVDDTLPVDSVGASCSDDDDGNGGGGVVDSKRMADSVLNSGTVSEPDMVVVTVSQATIHTRRCVHACNVPAGNLVGGWMKPPARERWCLVLELVIVTLGRATSGRRRTHAHRSLHY